MAHTASNGYGPALIMARDHEPNLWLANMIAEAPDETKIEAYFQVLIDNSPSNDWEAKIKLKYEKEVVAQDILLSQKDGFTLGSHSEPTFVRPLVISFEKLLRHIEEQAKIVKHSS